MRIAVDTSAMIAIAYAEEQRAGFSALLREHEGAISAGSFIELARVLMARFGARGIEQASRLVRNFDVTIVACDEAQTEIALDGMRRFGKGRGAPPAVLNYGDLFSYALARSRDLPLLYKGDDFAHTDVRSAAKELAG